MELPDKSLINWREHRIQSQSCLESCRMSWKSSSFERGDSLGMKDHGTGSDRDTERGEKVASSGDKVRGCFQKGIVPRGNHNT